MLVRLSIRDIVLIERLDLDFGEGLSVLTGETGAGKSILLDALSLSLGGRGDAGLVRHGATQGEVTAAFDVAGKHPARALLIENGIDDDGDILLRRIQTADGRTRVFVNDRPASVALMREIGRQLVEIHGQHDDRALVDTDAHRQLLDQFGGLSEKVIAVGRAWRVWREAGQALSRHRAAVEAAAREADYLRASVAELVRLSPTAGEETELAGLRASMMKAEKIAVEIQDAAEVLSGAQSPVPQLSALVRRLERKVSEVPGLLDETVAALDEALDALDRASSAVDGAARAIEFDPKRLEEAEERLFALRAAARKHSVAVEELPALRDRMSAQLADLDAGEERLASLQTAEADARKIYDGLALNLSSRRADAGAELRKAVLRELPALRLERADFSVEMTSEGDDPREEGIDVVEFHVTTNPGSRPGPLAKIASGGELSRFLLALKVALAERGSAPTLVFDEIDTGVGGSVADAIGQRLARLAKGVQVLSVTHAPQVAAKAGTHFLISKGGDAARVATGVVALGESARREEIARMLAGATITDEARAAAGRLLASAASG